MSDWRVIQGDCLSVMRDFAAGSFDAVITDPPFGLAGHNMRNAVAFMDVEWDDKPATDEQIAEVLRVSKTQIIWGGNYFNLPASRCFLVWDKGAQNRCGQSAGEAELYNLWNGG